MVMRALSLVFLLVSTLLFSCLLVAETQLQVSVDKTQLYENELLNCTIQANTEVDFSLSGLMSFGGSQVEPPEFDGLEDNWEVIDRQQGYNMQSINGISQSTITWRYTLSPRSSGLVTVPSATFKDAVSEAVEIEVVPGNRPRDASNPPTVFLKASVDKSAPYVQEQIIYTLELYTLGEARGDMSEPSHPDMIIEPIGETSKTYKMEFNRRYEVYERKYVLFPQKSGPLSIDPQVFTGNVVDNRLRQRARARELSNAVELDVTPPPSGYSGSSWLPAKSLFLNDSFEPNVTTIKQGDSITRKIGITALGLLGSSLPELDLRAIDGLKVYPDQPQVSSSSHSEGAQSMREEMLAYVAVDSGEVTLPEINITWWDTVNDIERVATVPERTITITPNAIAPANTEEETFVEDSGVVSSSLDAGKNNEGTTSSQAAESTNNTLGSETDIASRSPTLGDHRIWIWVTAIILVMWALHALWMHRQFALLKRGNEDNEANIGGFQNVTEASALISALQNNDQSISLVARQWLAALAQSGAISGRRFEYIHPELKPLLDKLESAHYSSNSTESQGDLNATRSSAIEIIETFSASLRDKTKKAVKHGLKSFN